MPFSGSVATVIDVVVPSGTAPATLTHRISYQLEPDAVFAALIGTFTIPGPEVTVDPRPAMVVSSPFASGRWLNVDGCCFAGTHRSVITSGSGLQLHKIETFAIDWVGLDGSDVFTGDGTKNTDYVGYGADILSATAGTVIAVRDGHPEPEPNQPPTLAGPDDFSGNSVVVQVAEDVYALYAHLQSGSVAVAVGRYRDAGSAAWQARQQWKHHRAPSAFSALRWAECGDGEQLAVCDRQLPARGRGRNRVREWESRGSRHHGGAERSKQHPASR